jgi:hypothetical protein
MNGVLPRVTIGRPALRAADVSIEIRLSTFFWKINESNARGAPAAPLASSETSSASFLPSTPPAALISSTASCAACTTDGATTLLAPLRPTGTPMVTVSAARAVSGSSAAPARQAPSSIFRVDMVKSPLLI